MAFTIAEAFVDLKSRGVKELNREFDRGSNRLRKFANQADQTGSRITDSTERARASMGRFGRLIDSARGGFGSLGQQGGGVLSQLTRQTGLARLGMVGLAAGAGLVAIAVAGITFREAISSAAAFESSLTNVATISRDVRQNFSQIGSQVLRISQRVNLDSTLLNAGLYQAVSAGITDTGEALKFLEVAAISARGGLTDVSTSVDVLTTVINAYGKQSSDAALISDQLFKTVELGKTTFGELARSMGNVAPIASQVGVDLEQVLAALAAITITGQSTGQAVTGLRAILAALLKPTASAEKEAKKLGFAFNLAALRSQGLQAFLEGLKKATGGSETSMAKFFESIEALNAVMVLTGSQADTFKSSIDEIANAAGVTKTAFDLQNKTFNSTVGLLKNELNVLFTELGNIILPTATKAVGFMADAVSALTSGLRDLKNLGPIEQEIEIIVPDNIPGVIGNVTAREEQQRQLSIEEFNKQLDELAAQGKPIPGEVGFRPGEFQQRAADPNAPLTFLTPQQAIQERRRAGRAIPITTERFDPNESIRILTPQQAAEEREQRRGVQAGPRRLPGQARRPRLLSEQPRTGGAIQAERADVGFISGALANLEQQNVTVEKQNGLIAEAINLYDRWLVTIEGVTAGAQERLERVNTLIGEQGLTLVDTEANLAFLGDGWKTYRNIVIPLNRQIAIASARGARPMLNFLEDLGNRKPTEIKKGMQSIGDSISSFFGESIQGFNRMGEQFDKFNATMETRAVRTEARLLEISGNRLNAQLLLLDQRTKIELANIDRTVKQTEIAETQKTRIVEQANAERKVIFREDIGAVPKIGDLAERVTTQQDEILAIDFSTEATDAQNALEIFTNGLIDSGRGTSRGMRALEATIQGGRQGGLLGALAGLGVAVISETEGFARLTESLDPLFDSLVRAIEPVISALADSLGPALEGIAQVLEVLQPLFSLTAKALGLLLKPVGILGKALGGIASFLFDFRSESEKFLAQRELEGLQTTAKRGDVEPRVKGIKDKFFGKLDTETDEIVAEKAVRSTGFTIANITGPTRDILVATLSPLKQLNTTFPLMLDELRMIRRLLGGESAQGFSLPVQRQEPNPPIIMVSPPSTERKTGTGGVQPNIIFVQPPEGEPEIDEPQPIGGQQRRGRGLAIADRKPEQISRQRQRPIPTQGPKTPIISPRLTGTTAPSQGAQTPIISPRLTGTTAPSQGAQTPIISPRLSAAPAIRMPTGDFSPAISQPSFNRQGISTEQGFGGDTSVTVNEVNVTIDQISDLSLDEIVDQVNAQLQRDLRITRRLVGTQGRRGRLSTSATASA